MTAFETHLDRDGAASAASWITTRAGNYHNNHYNHYNTHQTSAHCPPPDPTGLDAMLDPRRLIFSLLFAFLASILRNNSTTTIAWYWFQYWISPTHVDVPIILREQTRYWQETSPYWLTWYYVSYHRRPTFWVAVAFFLLAYFAFPRLPDWFVSDTVFALAKGLSWLLGVTAGLVTLYCYSGVLWVILMQVLRLLAQQIAEGLWGSWLVAYRNFWPVPVFFIFWVILNNAYICVRVITSPWLLMIANVLLAISDVVMDASWTRPQGHVIRPIGCGQ